MKVMKLLDEGLCKASGENLKICKICKVSCHKGEVLYLFPSEIDRFKDKYQLWKKKNEWFMNCPGADKCEGDVPILCRLSPLQVFIRKGKLEKLYIRPGCKWENVSLDFLRDWVKVVNALLREAK